MLMATTYFETAKRSGERKRSDGPTDTDLWVPVAKEPHGKAALDDTEEWFIGGIDFNAKKQPRKDTDCPCR
jgi:hypothetical protein